MVLRRALHVRSRSRPAAAVTSAIRLKLAVIDRTVDRRTDTPHYGPRDPHAFAPARARAHPAASVAGPARVDSPRGGGRPAAARGWALEARHPRAAEWPRARVGHGAARGAGARGTPGETPRGARRRRRRGPARG